MSLNLVPNELVGFRIRPDWYNFKVVVVKVHGEGSRQSGVQYDTPLAYCKSVESAAEWLLQHATRVRGDMAQQDAQALSGSVADTQALLSAMAQARADVLQAVAALKEELQDLDVSARGATRLLASSPP